MFTRTRIIFALGLAAPALTIALVGASPASPPAPVPQQVSEGIPVTSVEVRQACGACHPSDAEGRMSRISYRRATPENWELTVKRMLSLNNAQISTEQARAVLKYLSDNLGLAPEEARPVMFDAERRLIDFTYSGDTQTHNLCNQCHSMGRVLSERRTPDEWKLLIAMHRGVYPGIDGGSGGFRRGGGGGARGGNAGGANPRMPMDLATDHLTKAFPLASAEWSEWSAARAPVRLTGTWALSGHQPGLGPVYGQVTIEPQPGQADAFVTKTSFTYAKTGQTVTRTGRGIVYTGFQWRGRATEIADSPDAWREVAMISRDQSEISGRWFTGFYADTGLDVTLRRVTPGALVTGTDVKALKTGTTGQLVRIYGANLPAKIAPADVVLGAGVTVTRVVSTTPTMMTVTVDVSGDCARPRLSSTTRSTASP